MGFFLRVVTLTADSTNSSKKIAELGKRASKSLVPRLGLGVGLYIFFFFFLVVQFSSEGEIKTEE